MIDHNGSAPRVDGIDAAWRHALDEEVRALRALFDRVGVDAIASLREEVERLRAERALLIDGHGEASAEITRWEVAFGPPLGFDLDDDGVTGARARVEAMALCGRAVVKDPSVPETPVSAAVAKLLLRAYDAEAERALQTVRPEQLVPIVARLSRSRDGLNELARVGGWSISAVYHRARIDELHGAAAEIAAAEVRSQRARDEGRRSSERAEALRALRSVKISLSRERSQYVRLCRVGDAASAAMAATRLTQLGEALRDVEARERALLDDAGPLR
jgi:hypothetical protein